VAVITHLNKAQPESLSVFSSLLLGRMPSLPVLCVALTDLPAKVRT
jgi:hypothetical protein